MEIRMSTRRCVNGKIPCQEIHNVFTQLNLPCLNVIPDNIWKKLPSTNKISCDYIDKMKTFLPPSSSEQILKEIHQGAQLQVEQILKLTQEQIQPNNGSEMKSRIQLICDQSEIKTFEICPRKKIKKQNHTCEISSNEVQADKSEQIFIEQNIIERLQDYLTID